MATNDNVRFHVTSRFNGHDPGISFSTSRANAQAWAAQGLGYIDGEGPSQENGLAAPPQDKQVKRAPKGKGKGGELPATEAPAQGEAGE